jgi:hypothetical protein
VEEGLTGGGAEPHVAVLPAFLGVGGIAPGTRRSIRVPAVVARVCQRVVWNVLGVYVVPGR